MTSAKESPLGSAYRAAVTARDQAEQESHATSERLSSAPAALAAARQQVEQAQSIYTQARVKADQLWADLKQSAPRAFAPPLTLAEAQPVLPGCTRAGRCWVSRPRKPPCE